MPINKLNIVVSRLANGLWKGLWCVKSHKATTPLSIAMSIAKTLGSTEIWTRIAGFKVQSANHYTIEPQVLAGRSNHHYIVQTIFIDISQLLIMRIMFHLSTSLRSKMFKGLEQGFCLEVLFNYYQSESIYMISTQLGRDLTNDKTQTQTDM